MTKSTDTTDAGRDPAETMATSDGLGGREAFTFVDDSGATQTYHLRDADGDTIAEPVDASTIRNAIDQARSRDGVDWRRAAAEIRAADVTLGRAYDALMLEALSEGRPFEATDTDVKAALARAYAPVSPAVSLQRSGGRPTAFTAAELVRMELAPPKWLVEGVFPEGVTIIAGKPKLGKSRLMRAVAYALAAGGVALGRVRVEQCGVLYLHLEGGLAGLRQHVLQLAGGDPADVPSALDFRTDFPRGTEGVAALAEYFEAHPECRFVVIDTLKHFRESPDGRGSMYDEDYAATTAISKVCHRYGVHAALVHHASKRAADGLDDVLDLISGSTGLVAGVDNGAVLAKTSQGVILGVRPRDLEGVDLAVEWDDQLNTWRVMGDAAIHNASEQQKVIFDVIKDSPDDLQAYEIAQILEMDPGKVRMQLHRMREKQPPLVDRRGKAWVIATGSIAQQAADKAEAESNADGDPPQALPIDYTATEPLF